MNNYDKAARFAARELDGIGFLHWLLPPSVVSRWRWLGWLETNLVTFPGEPDRRCDTVAAFEHVEGLAPPVALVVEFQSRPQGELPERETEYELRLRRQKPFQTDPTVHYTALGAVVNLTGPVQSDSWSMAAPDFLGLGLWTKKLVRTLREEDAADLLERIAAGEVARCMLAWVPLLAGGHRAELIVRWRQLALGVSNARVQSELGGLALAFADLAKCKDPWVEGLEGWNMEQSTIFQDWEAHGVRKGVKVLREKLLRVLDLHIPGGIPVEVRQSIETQQELNTLSDWFDLALAASSWDEVRLAFGIKG